MSIGYGRFVQAVAKGGEALPVELAVGEARANGRRIYTAFLRDLTSRQKVDEEFRQAQTMEAVGRLAGGVAHDVNNLLTVIIANLELLAPNLADPDVRELADEAWLAAEDGARLAARLLAFARRLPLDPQPADLGALVGGCAGALRRTVGEAIEVAIAASPSSPVALVDPAQLQVALIGLAANARDAMPRGGRLSLDVSDPARRRLRPDLSGGPGRPLRRDHGVRHGNRHVARRPAARLRAVLHHQAVRRRRRARAQHDLRVRQAVGRPYPALQRAGARNLPADISAAGRRRSGDGDGGGQTSTEDGNGDDSDRRRRRPPAPRARPAPEKPRLPGVRGGERRGGDGPPRRVAGRGASLHRHDDARAA